MALKINLSKLNKIDGVQNKSPLGYKPITEDVYYLYDENHRPILYVQASTGKMIAANLQTLDWANKSYFVENSINLTKLKSDQENKNSFSLEFTEGEVYDLDDIIIAKKRDNADSPLILKVNTAAANDVAVIKAITMLIFNDYGLVDGTDFDSNIEDETSSLYYKNAVYKVPEFYEVFTQYFNRYYNIYYDKLNAGSLGALSVSSVIEEIQTVHDNIYGALLSKTPATNASFADSFYNKPQVEYDFGSIPSDMSGSDLNLDDILDTSKLSLTVDATNKKVGIKYDGKSIASSYVSTQKIIETVFDVSDVTIDDYGDGNGFTSDYEVSDVIIDFKN